jgi:hypothetical protein
MAGFRQNIINSWRSRASFNDFLKDLQGLGISDKQEMIRNSQAIGYGEENFSQMHLNSQNDEYEYLSLLNSGLNGMLPFFNTQYKQKLQEYRRIASEPDIENILETLSDECIVYDDKSNSFCTMAPLDLNLKNKGRIVESLERNFKLIYNMFGFNDQLTAWSLFKKFLVDGFISFEIIYDERQLNIIGFKIINPATLELSVTEDTIEQVWVQNKGDGINERILYPSQIVFLSYTAFNDYDNTDTKFSYVERLIKPFNMLHIQEQTRAAWALMNSSYRMKFIIPVGGKTKAQGKMALGALMSTYNEELEYDWSTGQYMMNGKQYIPGIKQYFLPSKNGETPEIETMGGDGPELTDVDLLIYYRNKLETISKIPVSRFRNGDGYESISNSNDSISQEEIKFNRFILRLRSIFQEILIKPIYIQTILDHPELKDDKQFKGAISIEYVQYNYFEKLKRLAVEEKIIDHIERLSGLDDLDGEPYFSLDFLISEYQLLSPDKMKENLRMKRIRQKELTEDEFSPYGEEEIEEIEPIANDEPEDKEEKEEDTEEEEDKEDTEEEEDDELEEEEEELEI